MKPVIHETAFVADNATVRGNVTIGEGAGIYFGAVLRAETDPITIGPGTNIQDNCVLHADPGFRGGPGLHHRRRGLSDPGGRDPRRVHGHGGSRQGPPPPDAGGDRIQRRSRRRLPPRIPAV